MPLLEFSQTQVHFQAGQFRVEFQGLAIGRCCFVIFLLAGQIDAEAGERSRIPRVLLDYTPPSLGRVSPFPLLFQSNGVVGRGHLSGCQSDQREK